MIRRPSRKLVLEILLGAAFVAAVVLGVSLGLAIAGTRNGDKILESSQNEPELPSTVLDINGNLITEFLGPYSREIISIDDIPQHLVDALLVREDRNFYTHHGFSIWNIIRAGTNNLLGRYFSGSSTITQQLVGALGYVDRSEITIGRKLKELWYAIQIERKYSKREILEMYLNLMYFGNSCYGVEAASKFYFGHSVKEITLAESAVLIIQLANPARYSHLSHPDVAKSLQKILLDDMVKEGFCAKQEAETSFNDFWTRFDYTRATETTAYLEREDKARYFSEYVRDNLEETLFGKWDLYKDGLKIYTTLNLDYQKEADGIMADAIVKINKDYQAYAGEKMSSSSPFSGLLDALAIGFNIEDFRYRGKMSTDRVLTTYTRDLNPVLDLCSAVFGISPVRKAVAKGYEKARTTQQKSQVQGALIALDSRKGYILAMVGGKGWTPTDQFNRTVNGEMEPGSAFKPLYYSAAIDSRKYTAATMILDQPIQLLNPDGTFYEPLNFKGEWKGRVLVRYALANSMNVPSIQILDGIGFDAAIGRASRLLGVTDPAEIVRVFPRYYPLGLGVSPVKPIQMARAFAVFANQGREVEPLAVRYIEDRNGRIIQEPEKELRARQSQKGEALQIMSPQTAFIMTNILETTVKEGTLAGAKWQKLEGFKQPIAGKTGTTQNWTDVWTVGFTPYITTAVWFGFDRGNRSLGQELTGASDAGPVWAEFMRYAHRDLPVEEFHKPETGITTVNVCAVSGLIPGKFCKKTYGEYFLSGTEPRSICEVCEFADVRSKTVNENLRNSLLGSDSLGDAGLDTIDVPPLEGLEPGKSAPSRVNPLLD